MVRGGRLRKQQGAPTVEAEGAGHVECTLNISRMSVTLDVSQLDMSALNWSKPE